MITKVAPAQTSTCMMETMPVIWNIGATTRFTLSVLCRPQSTPAIAACCTWLCAWMQPLGRPVVPLV